MKDKSDRRIVITDKEKVYIFQVELLLHQNDLESVRRKLKKEIEEGCVLLPPWLKLINEP